MIRALAISVKYVKETESIVLKWQRTQVFDQIHLKCSYENSSVVL